MPRVDLTGKPIIISGASSGIGAETAFACARAGMPVALGARRADRLKEIVDAIRGAGGKAIGLQADVTKPEDCARLVDACAEEFGSVYGAFANAGYGEESPLHRMPDRAVREMFETNLFGSLNLLRPALERMLSTPKQRPDGSPYRGHLLWCSSCLARMSLPYFSVYSATKAAQAHMATAMRLELRGEGVYVSSVHPIGTRTEFSQRVLDRAGGTARRSLVTPGMFKQDASYVADCIVAALRRPRPEVWPGFKSHAVRWGMAVATALPRAGDWGLIKAKHRVVGED